MCFPIFDKIKNMNWKAKKTKILLLFLFMLIGDIINAQEAAKHDPQKYKGAAQVSCGQCQFGLKAKGCTLAVRINGASYFVEGKKIDDFGDAHAKDGLCNAIHEANVAGTIKNGKFYAKKITLLSKK